MLLRLLQAAVLAWCIFVAGGGARRAWCILRRASKGLTGTSADALQEQEAHVLLRLALAVVAECEAELLQLHDFEDIITHLKVRTPRALVPTPTLCPKCRLRPAVTGMPHICAAKLHNCRAIRAILIAQSLLPA